MKIIVEFESNPSVFTDELFKFMLSQTLLYDWKQGFKIISEIPSGTITFDLIEKMVLDHCMITKDQLHLKSRDKDIVDARRLCYYLSKELHLGSARLIGKRFGNKDHATAYNGWLKATHYLQTDIDFKKNHKTFIESFFNHDTKDSETTKA